MGADDIFQKRLRYTVMWLALAMMVILFFLSIWGTFLGSQGAKALFNSPVLSVYWLVLMALLITAFVLFGRLIRLPGLLLIHAGCILILGGALWGSSSGLKVQNRLFGINRIQAGQMVILEGDSEKYVRIEDDGQIKELPFSIKLKDFRIEYYKPGYLEIVTSQGSSKMPVELGQELSLGSDFGTVTIIKVFENLKVSIDDNGRSVIDDPRPGYNPALQVQIKKPGGIVLTRYVFGRSPWHAYPGDEFLLRYHKSVRDYISDVQVIEDGVVVAEKSIEVNHPLHFGGYHFYQSSYDDRAHRYTVLSVVSDAGLNIVYAGYLALGVGTFWHFWIRHFFIFSRRFYKKRVEEQINGT